ncbi:hypothetical protein [Oleispirillum naphthae]|uniref:hypothetical protein n=1 Tax=Oleispirillum naphthae TaxID=2838853 RepID=UPI003082563D
MPNRRASFEFHVLIAKNWTVRDLFDDEAAAKRAAEQELSAGRVEGVRVIRVWQRADGAHTEKVVHEQLGAAKPLHDVRIVPIESAPFCRDEADLLSAESLAAMGRLYRKYLDEVCLTPAEVLHLEREYKRIWDTESIVPAGVDRVATIQTRGTDLNAKTRGEEIYRILESIGARALRCARRRSLPKEVAGSLGEVLAAVSREAEDELDGRFSATVVLARDLVQRRDWIAKLDRLGELIARETDAAALAILDGVTAQAFGCREVMQDALGPQPNLAGALLRMADLLSGAPQAEFDAALPRCEVFSAALRGGRLPTLHATLKDRFVRQLAGPGELARNDASQERPCFRKLANCVVAATAVQGGAETAEALLSRAGLFIVEGGVTGRKLALRHLLGALNTPACRMRLLRTLDESLKTEPEVRVAAFEAIRTMILSAGSVTVFAPGADPVAPLAAAADLCRWLAAAFPPKPAAPLIAHLDDLSARHLVRERIIERMDRPDLPLAERAILLLNFVLSGILTDGKASAMAREHIREHLKRPDFVEAFAAGCGNAADCERRLRDFHVLLARAGFPRG